MKTILLLPLLSALPVLASPARAANDGPEALRDEPIAAWRTRLLDLSFQAVSAMPLMPHIKDRSMAQEKVVETCLELGQAERARTYAEEIANWRKGACYADLGHYCAEHGAPEEAEAWLERASGIADHPDEENFQAWRRDRIRAKIAATLLLLGEGDKAARFEQGLVDSESSAVMTAKAGLVEADSFEAHVQTLEGLCKTGTFDQIQAALATCATLYDRFYPDAGKRALARKAIEDSYRKLPGPVRIDLLSSLAGSALGHDDQETALGLVTQARGILDDTHMTLDLSLPLTARLAVLRFRAGDEDTARKEVGAALGEFDAGHDSIVDIYRAATLAPVAEGYQAIGDGATALQVYRRVFEEGVHNPNSRPRSEDFAATCCSMARAGVEPDESLWKRLSEIRGELGEPW